MPAKMPTPEQHVWFHKQQVSQPDCCWCAEVKSIRNQLMFTRAELDKYDSICTQIRTMLTAAGIPELTDDRLSVIPLVERVQRLIDQRNNPDPF